MVIQKLMGDKSICITLILKWWGIFRNKLCQFFKNFVLNFPTRNPGWYLDGEI